MTLNWYLDIEHTIEQPLASSFDKEHDMNTMLKMLDYKQGIVWIVVDYGSDRGFSIVIIWHDHYARD